MEANRNDLVVANLVAVIERAAGDLSLAEEPARFAALLEDEAVVEDAG